MPGLREADAMKKLLVCLLFVLGCSESSNMEHKKPAKDRIEVVGAGGTCLRCGKDFAVGPDENGRIVLTPLCPECQK
jgi:hypothetical protein